MDQYPNSVNPLLNSHAFVGIVFMLHLSTEASMAARQCQITQETTGLQIREEFLNTLPTANLYQ